MRKLTLEIEGLEVESFAAQAAPEPRGTVKGHSAYPDCLYVQTYQPESCYDGRWWCGYTAYGCGGTGGTGTGGPPPNSAHCSFDPCYPIETPP